MSESDSPQQGDTGDSTPSSEGTPPEKAASDPPAPFLWLAHHDELEEPIWFLPLESEADSSVWDDETLDIEIVWWDRPDHVSGQRDAGSPAVDWQFDRGETLIRDEDLQVAKRTDNNRPATDHTTFLITQRVFDADSKQTHYELTPKTRGSDRRLKLPATSVHNNYSRVESDAAGPQVA